MDTTNGYDATEVCEGWPKEVCTVTKKKNRKVKPVTNCKILPRQFCAPAKCKAKEQTEECFDKVVTTVEEKPQEECNVEPVKNCEIVSHLVPRIEQVEECADVPREVCNRFRSKPKKIKKPILQRWCFNPTQASI